MRITILTAATATQIMDIPTGMTTYGLDIVVKLTQVRCLLSRSVCISPMWAEARLLLWKAATFRLFFFCIIKSISTDFGYSGGYGGGDRQQSNGGYGGGNVNGYGMSSCCLFFYSLLTVLGGGGGYGGGQGGFGGGQGGDRMSNLGAGLKQQNWGKLYQ